MPVALISTPFAALGLGVVGLIILIIIVIFVLSRVL